ncbi:MAG: hypothetical protein AAGF97_13355 [Planctomycetota bacterium]
MDITVADYRWLTGTAAEESLAESIRADEDPLTLVTRLRKSLNPVQAHLIAEQVTLRRRARRKFARADRMLFTALGLQQATGDALATYKASRFAQDENIADLCCGLGGDLLGLARRTTVEGVEQDEIAALLGAYNLRVINGRGSVTCGDAMQIDLERRGGWHMDPDRRPEGHRTVDPARYRPSLKQIADLLRRNPHASIKIAPAADFVLPCSDACERQWLGWDRECQQQVIWSGNLARDAGRRSASVIDDRGDEMGRVVGSGNERVEVSNLGAYLIEPHPAVIAARLVDAFAEQHGLVRIDHRVAYLSGDHPTDACGAASFEVLECVPFDERTLRAALKRRGLYPTEIKKRGVDLDPRTLSKRLRSCGDRPGALIVTPAAGRTWAILAQREGA